MDKLNAVLDMIKEEINSEDRVISEPAFFQKQGAIQTLTAIIEDLKEKKLTRPVRYMIIYDEQIKELESARDKLNG